MTNKPSYAILFVTSKCNSKCKMCFNWRNSEEDGKNDLTTTEYELISKKWNNIFHISLTGGEPLLRNDLNEIVAHFYNNSNTKSVGLTTNGLLPDKTESTIVSILRSNPNIKLKLSVSIDAIGAMHDNIRGIEGSFEKATETINKTKHYIKKYNNFELRINLTYCHYNEDDITSIIDCLDDTFGIPINIGIVRGDAREAETKEVSAEGYRAATEYIRNKYKKRKNASYLFRMLDNVIFGVYDITYRTLTEKRHIIDCVAGKNMLILNEKGYVLPCEMLAHVFPGHKFIFPDLRQYNYDINSALKSTEFKNVLEHIKTTNCFCTYECATMNSIIYNPLILCKILLNFK